MQLSGLVSGFSSPSSPVTSGSAVDFFKMTLTDPSELEALMDEAKYESFVSKL